MKELTTAQIAVYAGRSERHIQRLIQQGRIPAQHIRGNVYALEDNALESFSRPDILSGMQQQIDALTARTDALERIIEGLATPTPTPAKPKRGKSHDVVSRNVIPPQRTGMPPQAPTTDTGLLDQFLRRE